MSGHTTRRDFMKHSAAIGAAVWVGNKGLAAEDSKNPLERLNFACIGVDGKGSSDAGEAAKQGNVVAICDIDEIKLNKRAARKEFRDAKKFFDYRELISEMGDEIDAVTVSTPDHNHCLASVLAMRAGKHCFTQKPLTWSISEARLMRETAADKGVCTQMGNQGTSYDGLREAVEVIRSGAIGDVKEVHVWTDRPRWASGQSRPTETPPVPGHIHWEQFLGPAPYVSYHPAYQPFEWRGWIDYGTGALGDMACHTANMVVMALDLFEPTMVWCEQTTGVYDNATYPKQAIIHFEFPARGDLPPVKLTWYDGGHRPDPALANGADMPSSGSIAVGSEGTLYSPNDYGAKYFLLPEDKFSDYTPPEPTLPRAVGDGSDAHFQEFADACRAGEPSKAMSNFGYAGRLTETILLGNLALHAGPDVQVEWDAVNMKCTNIPELNKWVNREGREGWRV